MPNAKRPLRVLVVDDELIVADTLTAILCLRGYDAFELSSAEEALPWCNTHKPDVVIADVKMGTMSGVQLAILLADSLPECKVLLISGSALTSPPQKDWQSSGYQFAFMAKPVHRKTLLPSSTVSTQIKGRGAHAPRNYSSNGLLARSYSSDAVIDRSPTPFAVVSRSIFSARDRAICVW